MPHLIVFSHQRWNFACQRPQHLLSRLARHFPVLFIEEPVHDRGAVRFERAAPAYDVEVLRMHTPIAADGFHDDHLAVLRPLLAAYLRERGIDDYAVWFCTPMALPLLPGLNPRAVVYDCMDDLSAFDDAPPELREREAALLQAADLVLTGGPSLFESKRGACRNTLCLPSAVDADHFAPQRAAASIEAMLQAEQVQGRIPGPRLGFFGTIDQQIDTDLLAAMADEEPDWHIVMAGPVAPVDAAHLPRRRNIHWLGPQPRELLPQLVTDWDVCLLPLARNPATRFVGPARTLAYMAAEKPIVSTAVHDVVALFGDVVRIGHHTASFIEYCRWALSETAFKRAERVSEMLATVSRFSWDNTAAYAHEALAEVLARRPAPARLPQRQHESAEHQTRFAFADARTSAGPSFAQIGG